VSFIEIRTVSNGFMVDVTEPTKGLETTSVFTDRESLRAFVNNAIDSIQPGPGRRFRTHVVPAGRTASPFSTIFDTACEVVSCFAGIPKEQVKTEIQKTAREVFTGVGTHVETAAKAAKTDDKATGGMNVLFDLMKAAQAAKEGKDADGIAAFLRLFDGLGGKTADASGVSDAIAEGMAEAERRERAQS
jgi:hypothetical protein